MFVRRSETPREGRLYAVVEVQNDGEAFDARVVDDAAANTSTARSLGMPAITYRDPEQLHGELAACGLG